MARIVSSNKKPEISFLIIFTVWWSFWFILQWVLLQDLNIEPLKGLVDSLISNVLLASFCLLLFNNMRYYLPGRERWVYILVISVALSSLWLFLLKLILKLIYKTDVIYLDFLGNSSSIRYAFGFLNLVSITTLSLLWYSRLEQEEDNKRKADMIRLAKDAELNKLRQQLQPHFLFNSLNSISALTGSHPEKARHMIQQLADFLRGTIRKEEQLTTSYEEELQYLQLYLEIEKVRFGYRLQTHIENEEQVLAMKLPALLLQPLVENAIKFGLYDTVGEVTILITAKKNNGMLQVSIQNPFDEFTALPVKGTGYGLSSIKRRLYLLFSRNDLLQVKKEDGNFITIISIPQIL